MACCSERVVEALTSGAAVNLSVQMARSWSPSALEMRLRGDSRLQRAVWSGAASRPGAGGQERKATACTMEPRRGPSEDNGVLGDPQ